ncbi:hypothetical protein [Catellatospora methionotrophica]
MPGLEAATPIMTAPHTTATTKPYACNRPRMRGWSKSALRDAAR